MMFRKNSAFTPTDEEFEHLEGVAKRALAADPFPPGNRPEKKDADALLEAALSVLDDRDYPEVHRLISSARDELSDRPGPRTEG